MPAGRWFYLGLSGNLYYGPYDDESVDDDRDRPESIIVTDRLVLWYAGRTIVGMIHESLLDMAQVSPHRLIHEE